MNKPAELPFVIPNSVLSDSYSDTTEHNARCLINNARETLIDVECAKYDEGKIRTAIVGLECALVLIDRLMTMAMARTGQ